MSKKHSLIIKSKMYNFMHVDEMEIKIAYTHHPASANQIHRLTFNELNPCRHQCRHFIARCKRFLEIKHTYTPFFFILVL